MAFHQGLLCVTESWLSPSQSVSVAWGVTALDVLWACCEPFLSVFTSPGNYTLRVLCGLIHVYYNLQESFEGGRLVRPSPPLTALYSDEPMAGLTPSIVICVFVCVVCTVAFHKRIQISIETVSTEPAAIHYKPESAPKVWWQ